MAEENEGAARDGEEGVQPDPIEASMEYEGSFPRELEADLDVLARIGGLGATLTFYGRKIGIRTYDSEAQLACYELANEHASLGQTLALKLARVAAAVETVDGKSLRVPIGEETALAALRGKLQVVLKWFPLTVDAVDYAYALLQVREQKVIDALDGR